MSPYLSVIVPAYNESVNLRRGALDELVNYLTTQAFTWEMVVVNDGSVDDTGALLSAFVAAHPHVRLINNTHQGKAATVMTGVMAAIGEIVLFTDMDQATPITEFAKFKPHFSSYDIVIGSRSGRKGAPPVRKLLALGMVVTRSVILRLPFKDTQCGFKAFKQAPAKKLFGLLQRIHPPQTITGPAVNAGFDVELLYLARKLGYKVLETPVVWEYRQSKRVSFIKDTVTSVTELLRIRFRSLTGAYRPYLA